MNLTLRRRYAQVLVKLLRVANFLIPEFLLHFKVEVKEVRKSDNTGR